MRARGTLPFYIGGFLGPFGGGVVAVLVPQLRDAFDATTAEGVKMHGTIDCKSVTRGRR